METGGGQEALSHLGSPFYGGGEDHCGVSGPLPLPEGLQSLVVRLAPWATWLSARYGGAPVYLVGGALRVTSTEDHPRDIDVVVEISQEDFRIRFGVDGYDFVDHKGLSRYYRETSKLVKEALDLLRLPIDLQIQVKEEYSPETPPLQGQD